MVNPKSKLPFDRYNLNLAGEYRVAAELLLRGLFATVTYGNKKGADIFAIGKYRRAAVVEVKASQKSRFVTGLYQKYPDPKKPCPDFWVLYDVKRRGDIFEEQFFVLSHEELAKIQGKRNCKGEELSYEEYAARVKKGVDNVLVNDVEEFKDAWDKIIQFCDAQP